LLLFKETQMPTGTFILTEGDDGNLAGSNVISLIRPEMGDPVSIGDLASLVVADAAVKMRGQFSLPRVVALAIREETDRESR
jgi:hypothetical protein